MATPRRELHVADERYVLTYEVDGVPVGVITGEMFGDRAHLEHMILFPDQPPMFLTQMLAAAFQWVMENGVYTVTFIIDAKQPKARALQRLAQRHGFEEVHPNLWRIILDENAPTRSGSGYCPVPPMPPDLADADADVVRERELARLARERSRRSMDIVHAVTTAVVGLGG